MQFSLPQSQLLQSLNIINRAISSRSVLPILTGVLLEARDGALRLVGSDNETWMELSVPATVAAAGSLVVPARYLMELVRRIPSVQVSLNANMTQRTLNVSWGRGKLAVHGFDAADFPGVPQVIGEVEFEVGRVDLLRMIRQTHFAMSSDATRAVFTGTLVTRDDDRLTLVTTDGFRLALSATRVALPAGQELGAIVPGRVLGDLAAIIDGEGPSIQLSLSKQLICFRSGSLQVVTRLIEGHFPPYRQVIPRDFPTSIQTDRTALEQACDLALAALRESGQAMRLDLSPARLLIQANAPERGDLEEEVPVQFEGEPMKVAFNPRYFVEGIRVIETQEVRCRFTGSGSAACVYGKGQENFLYVVLPVKVE
ncbi:MAG TPA: DNA polymerase III subunit beta [Bacillota bacterium]|nr:DNA polymerase III subunit beta [Bacillota bacterium]